MIQTINPKYERLTNFIKTIPDIFETQGTSIYKARNELKTYNVGGYNIVVKSFQKPHFINRIAYGFFRSSKAKRSYEYAPELLKRNVPTPEPIAFIEDKKNGLLNRSFYICLFEKEYEHIRQYMNGEKKDDALLKNLAAFIADVHNKGVDFWDMSPGNILWKKTETGDFLFSLVDINRMNFKPHLSEKERIKRFERLSYKNDVIDALASHYANVRNLDKEKTVADIKNTCARFFMKKYNRKLH